MSKRLSQKCNINERVGKMIEEFIEFMKKDNVSENTYMSYASDIKLYMQYYEDSYGEEITELNHSDIIMYVNYLKRNQTSARTINRKIAALKKYNLFLIDEGLQKDVVIVDKDYIKIQKSFISKKVPTVQEMNKIQHIATKDEKNQVFNMACMERPYSTSCNMFVSGNGKCVSPDGTNSTKDNNQSEQNFSSYITEHHQ